MLWSDRESANHIIFLYSFKNKSPPADESSNGRNMLMTTFE